MKIENPQYSRSSSITATSKTTTMFFNLRKQSIEARLFAVASERARQQQQKTNCRNTWDQTSEQ
jgi:hypothetical protein